MKRYSTQQHSPLPSLPYHSRWRQHSSNGQRKRYRKWGDRQKGDGFSFAVLIPRKHVRKNCSFPRSGSKPLATAKHRFSCWNDKMALLCYMEVKRCRNLQPFQYKKHKYERFPDDKENSSTSLPIISDRCQKG